MKRLTKSETEKKLRKLSGWKAAGARIERDFVFGKFQQAVDFVNRVAEAAESMDHHPDILVHSWNKVRLSLSTHNAGGVTEKDFKLAWKINKLTI